jgi:hypothetical protein
MPKQVKTQRRLARKAEAARQSRQRKKAYVNQLEDKLAQLQERLHELDSSTGVDESERIVRGLDNTALRGEQSTLKMRMQNMIEDPPIWQQPEMTSKAEGELRGLSDLFVTNSRKRQNGLHTSLQELREQLIPSAPIKVAMWGLNQKDQSPDKTNPGLWNTVLAWELGLTPEQQADVMQLKHTAQPLLREVSELQSSLGVMEEEMHETLVQRHRHMDELRAILSPKQFATFVTWLEKNPIAVRL